MYSRLLSKKMNCCLKKNLPRIENVLTIWTNWTLRLWTCPLCWIIQVLCAFCFNTTQWRIRIVSCWQSHTLGNVAILSVYINLNSHRLRRSIRSSVFQAGSTGWKFEVFFGKVRRCNSFACANNRNYSIFFSSCENHFNTIWCINYT